MRAPVERYTSQHLLAPTDRMSVMRHEVRDVDVHWHDFYELAYVIDGTATHRLNGHAEVVTPGSVFLMTPADFHELSSVSDEPLTYLNVVIDAGLMEAELDELPVAAVRSAWRVPDASSLAADFRRLYEESTSQRPAGRELAHAVLRCILIELARRCGSGSECEPAGWTGDQPEVRRAVLFLDRHFRQPLTLADVAAQAHLSPNYFSERFHEFTGTSFQSYLQHRRLAFARSLLASTALGVTDVCHAAGFNSLSHFGRAYRSRYGESPTGFRTRRDAGASHD